VRSAGKSGSSHKDLREVKAGVPGIIATTLLVITTSLWAYWGTAEMVGAIRVTATAA
jgi:hypothetical protein